MDVLWANRKSDPNPQDTPFWEVTKNFSAPQTAYIIRGGAPAFEYAGQATRRYEKIIPFGLSLEY